MPAKAATVPISDAAPTQARKRKHSSKDSSSRDSKPKKRRRHAELNALPSVPDDSENEASAAENDEKDTKSDAADLIPLSISDPTSATADPSTDNLAAKKKKSRRKKKTAPITDGDAVDTAPTDKKNRFIAFIGNLPFDTTTQSLSRHFSSISPLSIRHLTEKSNWNDPSLPSSKLRNSGGEASTAPKSKGYAFLEFENYDRLLTCLKLYHHSMFSAVEGKGSTRRINVELTAGGGGAGEGRKEKLRVKNERLGEERKRNYVKDKDARDKDRKAKKARESEVGATGANADGVGDTSGGDGATKGESKIEAVGAAVADVHPERMRMLENGGRGGHTGRGGAGRGPGGDRGGGDRGRGRGRSGRGGRGRF